MTIQDYQVLQRDADDKARVRLNTGDTLELPVGGPYQVGAAHHVLVGDLWVLAGQSSMEGCGDMVNVQGPSLYVHSYQSCEQWTTAEEPLHWLTESPRPVHHYLLGREPIPDRPEQRDPHLTKGAGLGLTFATLRYASNGVPVGLIPCAHRGTSMEQWDPLLGDQGGHSLYGATSQRIKAIGGKVAGILWYQGEAETHPDGVRLYHERMVALVDAFRADLRQPHLPFYYVQVGRVVGDIVQGWNHSPAGWNGVREAQRHLVAVIPNTAMVTAVDLELDDLVHIGTCSLKRLGRRLAQCANGCPSLDVAAIQVVGPTLRITFSGVQGELQSLGQPAGFSLRHRDGDELQMVYKVTLDGSTAILHLTCDVRNAEAVLPPETYLWYGWGLNPYCNVTDGVDAAVPAFGPLRVSEV